MYAYVFVPGYMSHRIARWPERLSSGAGSGQGGGDDSKGGPYGLQDGQVQQQIIHALQQLREAMQSVMERLEVVEGLATANVRKLNKIKTKNVHAIFVKIEQSKNRDRMLHDLI